MVLGTNGEQILCKCNHLTSFGSELFVAPNPSDFDSVFNNFDRLAQNVAVLALISTILGGYIIGVIWARRADKRDLLMVGEFNYSLKKTQNMNKLYNRLQLAKYGYTHSANQRLEFSFSIFYQVAGTIKHREIEE